jgi:hypothetical protein
MSVLLGALGMRSRAVTWPLAPRDRRPNAWKWYLSGADLAERVGNDPRPSRFVSEICNRWLIGLPNVGRDLHVRSPVDDGKPSLVSITHRHATCMAFSMLIGPSDARPTNGTALATPWAPSYPDARRAESRRRGSRTTASRERAARHRQCGRR